MGFLRNLFKTAGEVAQLTQIADFYQRENERLILEIKEANKRADVERRAKDKFVLTFCDQLSKHNHLPTAFKEKVPLKEVEPEIDNETEASIQYTAEIMRQADVDDERITERPLEDYIAEIRKNPGKYLQWRQQ